MKKLITIVMLCMSFNSFADSTEDAVEYRQAAFKLIKANFANMGAMVKGKIAYNAKVFNKNAINLKALSSMPWVFFDEKGDDTNAADSIWEDSKKFKKTITHFKKVVSQLDKGVSTKTELTNAKPLFAAVAKTCKDCHKNFRED